MARYPLGPLTLYRLTADASLVTRTRAMIGESDPEWVQVSLLLGGRCIVDQDGRRSLLRAGDFASWASSRPYAVDAQTQHDLLVTYCPARSLRDDRILRSTATAIPGADGAARLVRRYLRTLVGDLQTGNGAGASLADGLLDLFDALYGGRVVLPRAPEALCMLVRGHVDEHLADPALAGESILAIATRWGFVSPAHFSRTFRAAYGVSPRELRPS